MPILASDIQLVASQVMADVPEGGGAPTSTVLLDGASNQVFPDISEVDRAGGAVNVIKVFATVGTDNTDTYLDANIIVAEPPADPNVSVTLFTTGDVFDRRDAAKQRIESYLTRGSVWGGYLFENHVAGQRVIQLAQRPGTSPPPIGRTLVLIYNEGLSTEREQYVRTTRVESEARTLYDPIAGKDFQAQLVTCDISDALRFDFPGTPPTPSFTAGAGKAITRDTTVADAATYFGVSPLAASASIGNFTVSSSSVFTQLVPSAQTETPISDVRTNGLASALVATGGAVTQSLALAFTTTQNMFVGGAIYPGSLSIVRDGVTLNDQGGLLVNAGSEVGQVDYDNGIASLSANVWGTGGGTHQVTFAPAAVPDLISDQRAIRVTLESRSLSYALTMGDVPLPRTLSVSYLAQGVWYVLRDNGAGVLSGLSSSYGIGTISYTTGNVVFTLGALPDVGSSIVLQSFSRAATVQASNTLLANNGRVYVPINSDGLISADKGSKTFSPTSIAIAWNDGTARTATDNGSGALTGDATGRVDYANGVLYFSPNVLPAPGVAISVGNNRRASTTAIGVTLASGSLGALNITPGSISAELPISIEYRYADSYFGYDVYIPDRLRAIASFATRTTTLKLSDDGAGNLFLSDRGNVGTINYTTGAIAITSANGYLTRTDIAGPVIEFNNATKYSWNDALDRNEHSGQRYATLLNVNGNISYANTAPTADTLNVSPTAWLASTLMVPNYTLKGVAFGLGATRYQQLTDGTLLKDASPTTGGGITAGSVAAATGIVSIQSWPTGASSLLADWRGLIAPPSVGVQAPFTAFSSVFRTASSPLRGGSFSILGTMQDGTPFNVTADTSGKINGTRVKGRIDVQFGLVELYFVNPAGEVGINTDLSFLQIAGLTTIPADLALLSSLRYNAVAYSYLPLDANILGIDPVRLPTDGRVPIFRAGGFAVLGNTQSVTATVANSQTIDCARVRLSRVRVAGSNGITINTGYTQNLEAGTVTFTDVTGYSQPVTIEHRIEDMAVISDVQISGQITFTRPLTHAYPVLGSYLSSALVVGDLFARVPLLFDQASWDGITFTDAVSGNPATGSYNSVNAPLVVTNRGAVTERWALQFTNSTQFRIIGQNVGVLGTGDINTATSPNNPVTGTPYFTVPLIGWGVGWVAGNILRFNTVGSTYPLWLVRTIRQGAESVQSDRFSVLVRGDVDRP